MSGRLQQAATHAKVYGMNAACRKFGLTEFAIRQYMARLGIPSGPTVKQGKYPASVKLAAIQAVLRDGITLIDAELRFGANTTTIKKWLNDPALRSQL